MKERPILFSAAMVRAILEGRKTQTRRVVNAPRRAEGGFEIVTYPDGSKRPMAIDGDGAHLGEIKCPYGQPGDRLWVRETWGLYDTDPKDGPESATVFYRATDGDRHDLRYQKWRPSIHMPRWASRITLEITGVRVERLQDITNNDALDEGTPDLRTIENGWDMRRCFQDLWEQINGVGSWAENPWVWVIEFRRVTS